MTSATIEHRYRPVGSAKQALECRDPEILLSGPAGTGKSRALLEKLMLLALKHPGMRGLIVRKTATSLTTSALVTWKEHVIRELLLTGEVDFYGGSAAEPPQYRFRNGSRVMIGGMDKATRIMSTEYDVIYVQEAIELAEADWEALTSRLRNGVMTFQQLMGDTNPDTATHWLKTRCNLGTTTILWSKHADNPLLYGTDGTVTAFGEKYLARLRALTGVRRQRLYEGKWVSAEGMIYEDWNPAIHLIDKHPIPPEWTRWWCVDFGHTNPFVCQWWAEDPDGRLILYREVYWPGRLVEDHAKTIMAQVTDLTWEPGEGETEKDRPWTEPYPRAIICDHDAEDRATLERHVLLPTSAARKTVLDGLQAVAERLRKAQDGLPRLSIMRDCVVERHPDLIEASKPTCTAEEFPAYIWDAGAALRGKEQPLKVDDHGIDCVRYIVAERDLRGRPRVRFL